MRLTRIAKPSGLPVSLFEARRNLRVYDSGSDQLILDLIQDARSLIERNCGIRLNTTSQRWELDSFPAIREVELPVGPLDSLTSIKYYATDDSSLTTLSGSDYEIHARQDLPAIIELTSTSDWPNTDDRIDAVQVDFLAGYGNSPEDVPHDARCLIKLLVSHWFDAPTDRGGVPAECSRLVYQLFETLNQSLARVI